MSLDVATVEEKARDKILAIDPSPYDQAGIASAWTEVRQLGAIEESPQHVRHLHFVAKVSGSPSSGTERETDGLEARLRSRLGIIFGYRIRPTDQLADSRMALRAAHQVVKAINAHDHEWNVELINAGEVVVSEDGRHVYVAITFDVFHSIEV